MKPSEGDWMKIYVDRSKLTALHNQLRDKKGKMKDILKKLELSIVFVKMPLTELIPDTELEKTIDTIIKNKPAYDVKTFVNCILSPDQENCDKLAKGDIVVIEALNEMEEIIRITSPTGRSLPILKNGSYLAYRPPTKRLSISDGEYQEIFVVDIIGKPGNYDMIKLFVKEEPHSNLERKLKNWNNCHARIIGLVGTAPPYTCRITGDIPEYKTEKTSSAIYVLRIDVFPPKDSDLVQRLNLWYSWEEEDKKP